MCVRVYMCGGRERGVRGVCIYVCMCAGGNEGVREREV